MAKKKKSVIKERVLVENKVPGKALAEKGYWKSHLRALSCSAKRLSTKRFWQIASLDAIAIALIWALLSFSGLIIEKSSEPALRAEKMALSALDNKDFESYDSLKSQAQSLQEDSKRTQAVVIAATFILLVLIVSVLYDSAWAAEKERKVEFNDLGNKFLANAFWIVKWLLIFLLTLALLPLKPATLLITTLALIALYADPAFRYLYEEKESALKNTTRGFKVAFTKALKYLPFLVSFILLSALLLSMALAMQAFPKFSTLLTGLSVVVLLGFARSYVILLG